MAEHGFGRQVGKRRHLLGIAGLDPGQIRAALDLAETYISLNRQGGPRDVMRGRTLMNMFFEASTRTRTSFELAGKRLGADVINMSPSGSSVAKGETLIDTAMTLNAMHVDVLVVRHDQSGAAALLAQKLDASVINAGDGTHEHPTQALLDGARPYLMASDPPYGWTTTRPGATRPGSRRPCAPAVSPTIIASTGARLARDDPGAPAQDDHRRALNPTVTLSTILCAE